MDKKILTFLFLGGLLLCACSETAPSEEPVLDTNEYTEDGSLFRLISPEDSVVLVHDKVKEYTDKMYKQRDDDNARDEDKILSPLHSDTVKVRNFKGNYDMSVPVELSFFVDDSIKDETFKVRYWLEGEDDNFKEIEANSGKVYLKNLFRGSAYEWCVVTSGMKRSAKSYFYTADYVRFVTVGSLYNVRDIGGWKTLDGKRIKQGLMYRGCEINAKFTDGHKKNVTDEGIKDFKDLGIKLELDLRTDEQAGYITSCGFDSNVEYVRLETWLFHEALNPENGYYSGPNYKIIFENILTNADKMPIYSHCYGGSDRSGTLCFLLGAILGMSYTDLVIDFEASTFSDVDKEHDISRSFTYWPEMIEYIQTWDCYSPEKSLKEIIETYLTTVMDIDPKAIERIREIFLEDIPD